MNVFNQNNRTQNVLKTSLFSCFSTIVNLLIQFIYRVVFLHILTASYLGISGLFTNLLQLLSLAELGITSAITFRFYEPISRNDIKKVSELMLFLKRIYVYIAIIILTLGMVIYPFLGYFIKDTNEIPADVNINYIYILFLIQTISTYICAYKHVLLSADQKQYMLSFFQSIVNLTKYLVQILILILYQDYMLSLMMSIISTICCNILIGQYVTGKYREVFKNKSVLSQKEKKLIISDTKATICHKIGGVILNGTDNLVLSSFAGLTAAGLYSNYALVISGINSMLTQLLGSFTSSFGSAHVELAKEKAYCVYKRLIFLNFWIAGLAASGMYIVLNDMIEIWVGKNMVLNKTIVLAICVQFFFEITRKITTSYTNGCGLFIKDKIRPLIEALINLSVSIYLVKKIGISGIFWGTIISHLLTVFWREPYILYKYEFEEKLSKYWRRFILFFILTLLTIFLSEIIINSVTVSDSLMITIIFKATVCFIVYNVLALCTTVKSDELFFYSNYLKKLWKISDGTKSK